MYIQKPVKSILGFSISFLLMLPGITVADDFDDDDSDFVVEQPSKNLPPRLQELHAITEETNYEDEEKGVTQIRMKTLKQAAFSWGVQEGLHWRYSKIVDLMESRSLELHTIFNFNKFIVDGKMLLPSMLKAERIHDQKSEITARTVKASLTLNKPARLVPQTPTWREFLIRNIDKPKEPHHAIFPRTEEESLAWVESLNRGWEKGVSQADEIHDIDLRRLEAELDGMYEFRKLMAMSYVTMPKISSSKYSVIRLDDGKTLNLNDVVYTITAQSNFTDPSEWEPFFRPNDMGEE